MAQYRGIIIKSLIDPLSINKKFEQNYLKIADIDFSMCRPMT